MIFQDLGNVVFRAVQQLQNKCMRFCLQLDKMLRICAEEFLELNQLRVHDRNLQFVVSNIFEFSSNQYPDYLNEVFCTVDDDGLASRSSSQKLKLSFCKSKIGKQCLLYVDSNTPNKLSNNLETEISINCFKQDIKTNFLRKLSDTEVQVYCSV